MPPDAPEKPPAPNPGKAETPIGSAESKRSGQAFSAEPSLPAGPGHADPLYGHIVEDQTEVISRFKADGTFTFVNDVYCRFFGKAREELVGHQWQPRAVAEDLPQIEAKLRTLDPAHPVAVIENRVYAANGEVRWMQFVNRAFFDRDGRNVETQSVGRDVTERKQAELALRNSQNLLRSFYDSAPFMMGVVELDGDRIIGVEANAQVAAFFERTPAQMAECDGREMNHNDSITQLWLEKYRQSQREQRSVRFEYQHPTRAGLLWLSVCVAPLLDSSTPRPRFSFVVEDVTERKRSEEALNLLNATLEQQVATRTSLLREREELLKVQYDELDHIYRTAPVGLCHLDSELRYVRINDRLAEMNGRPAAEHLGRTPLEIVPVITAQTMALMRQVLATGQPLLNVAFRGATPSAPGIQRDWISHFYPLRSEAGKCLGLSVVVVEVTELKAALAALEHSRSILADAQRIAHLGSFEYDVATGQTTWSEEQYRIYGVDPAGPSPNRDELLAKWTLPEEVAHLSDTFNKAVLSRSVFELEHRIVRADGAVRWTYDRAQPYLDEQGELVRYLGTTQDITERKQAEEALLQYQDRLRALTQRLHSVREEESHRISRELHDELGQMLTGVKMELRLAERELESEVLTPRDAALLERVMSATELTDAMAKSVQRIALELRLALPDRLGLFAALRQEVQQFQERSGIRISLQLPENEPELSASVTTACYRICQEALTNIARHSGATEAAIELRADQRASEWVLEVRDNGRGIPSNPLGNPPSLGLLGMQERARSLGGEVRVTPGAPGGTVVCLRLPRDLDKHEGP